MATRPVLPEGVEGIVGPIPRRLAADIVGADALLGTGLRPLPRLPLEGGDVEMATASPMVGRLPTL